MTDEQAPKPQGPSYSAYYKEHAEDRNDILSNPGVLFQTLAFDRANVKALSRLELDRRSANVLDVGCGVGAGLLSLVNLGFDPANLHGVDLDEARISSARRQAPNIDFRCRDARQLDFPDGAFDLVTESTMFVLMTDEDVASAIAAEMIRVTKPGSYIMLVDWRYGKPGNTTYRGLSRERIAKLFEVGRATEVKSVDRGALVPPVGRFLSRYAPSLYFVVQGMIPPLVGQVTTVLRRTGTEA